eukprot:CAMPEP_0181183046 /NCGR_PEP_ID=MMETSP1096-20121128/8214_1 /TAXON_ID=156174 ORGANISM="Chrysochromulina ericina, Strain CCMP281" /NCGR_SAMPLE_ID=MMETSP1096 /ASSEMBLY_ACC=CAM_ASM_000453 /LENGTH=283 /DNA_ID=CAMNT_0023271695 /DNA_START=1 /DNA_END=851 /DNA_ORIENTATION=+
MASATSVDASTMAAASSRRRIRARSSPAPGTYELHNSVGRQSASGKVSMSQWRIGTGDRSGQMHPTHSGKTPGPANYTMHSSIGAQRLSQRPSSATYDFGTMERARAAKMYIGPIHARAYPAVSPGPAGTSRENSDNAYRDLERPVSAQNYFGTEVRASRSVGAQGPGPGDYRTKDVTFGPQAVSRRRTAEAYGFGSSTRADQGKVFISKGMAENPATVTNATSPGPAYMAASGIGPQKLTRGRSAPSWGFGTNARFKGNGGMRGAANPADMTPGPGAYNAVY